MGNSTQLSLHLSDFGFLTVLFNLDISIIIFSLDKARQTRKNLGLIRF